MAALFVTEALPSVGGDSIVSRQFLTALSEFDETRVCALVGEESPRNSTRFLGSDSAWKRVRTTIAAVRGVVSGTVPLLQARVATRGYPQLCRLAGEPAVSILFFNHLRTAWIARRLPRRPGQLRVFLAHNSEGAAHRSLAAFAPNPFVRGFWQREARKLECLERDVLQSVDLVFALTPQDRERLASLCPGMRIEVLPPWTAVPAEAAGRGEGRRVLLLGSYLWHPKLRNAVWLARSVFPRVRARVPTASLSIVGNGASRVMESTGSLPGVEFHNNVSSTAPYLAGADVFVNPERQIGGIKLKSLEAASYGLPIVSTPEGVEGTGLVDGMSCYVASDAASFAERVAVLLERTAEGRRLGEAARQVIQDHFSKRAFDERFAGALRAARPGLGDMPDDRSGSDVGRGVTG